MLLLFDHLNRMAIRRLGMLLAALRVQNYGQLNLGQQQTNLMQPPSEGTENHTLSQENDE